MHCLIYIDESLIYSMYTYVHMCICNFTDTPPTAAVSKEDTQYVPSESKGE